jgi:hypothetical protein
MDAMQRIHEDVPAWMHPDGPFELGAKVQGLNPSAIRIRM